MTTNVPMSIHKRKMKIHISKSLSIVKIWETIGPIVAEHIAGPEYSPVPYLIDTNAYQIGHIFVQNLPQVQCFCAAPVLKVLGPINDFVVREKCDPQWLKGIVSIKSTGDDLNFQVNIENAKNSVRFRAYDCFFLDKPPDMSVGGNVTIDRSSHEDLSQVDWFGLITGVVAVHISDIFLTRHKRNRVFYIGEKPHTILFKYEICRINEDGTVYETSSEKMECRWEPVQERDLDALPLTEFVSQNTKIKS